MKKGFTIVEIIVSICLIGLIGVSVGVFIVSKKNDNKIDDITDKIIDATNAYINIEVDDNGNTYKNGILNGGVGVEIGVKSLLSKGYIDENIYKELVNKTNKNENELKLLVSVPTSNKSDKVNCEEGIIEYQVSWDTTTSEPIYLCNYKSEQKSDIIITYKNIIENSKFTNNFDKMAVSQKWCDKHPDYDSSKIVCDENGVYTYYNQEDNIVYYYFRGAVDNNYLKFQDKMWRIVWTSSENKMKLVLDDEIKIKLNDTYEVKKGDVLSNVEDNNVYPGITEELYNYFFDNDKNVYYSLKRPYDMKNINFWYVNGESYIDERYTVNSNDKVIRVRVTYDLNKKIEGINGDVFGRTNTSGHANINYEGVLQYYKDRNIYFKTMYENANYSFDYIYGIEEYCLPIDLKSDTYPEIMQCTKINSSNYSDTELTKNAKVGYLTIDELKLAGVGTYLENVENLDNYLLPTNNNDSYYLSEIVEYEDYSSNPNKNYFVDKYGINNNQMFYLRSYYNYYSLEAGGKHYDYDHYYKGGTNCNPYCITASGWGNGGTCLSI